MKISTCDHWFQWKTHWIDSYWGVELLYRSHRRNLGLEANVAFIIYVQCNVCVMHKAAGDAVLCRSEPNWACDFNLKSIELIQFFFFFRWNDHHQLNWAEFRLSFSFRLIRLALRCYRIMNKHYPPCASMKTRTAHMDCVYIEWCQFQFVSFWFGKVLQLAILIVISKIQCIRACVWARVCAIMSRRL